MKRYSIPAVILAGGRSSRMQVPEKCLLTIGGESMLARVIAAVQSQVDRLLINSNSDPALFTAFDLPVRADVLPGRLGPLAGVHTAMAWAREHGHEFVATVPADAPFLPHDVIRRMMPLRQYKRPVILSDGIRLHPTVGLWPTALAERLAADLRAGVTRMQAWCKYVGAIEFLYLTDDSNSFLNLNAPADVDRARRLLSFLGPPSLDNRTRPKDPDQTVIAAAE